MFTPINKSKPEWPEQFEIESLRQTGFIAQEVEAAAKKLGFNFSGVQAPKNGNGLYSLRYSDFVMPLVQAVKEQQVIIEAQEKKILKQQQNEQAQNNAIASLQERLAALEKLINK
jgi:trimeric autotransporter adhesin